MNSHAKVSSRCTQSQANLQCRKSIPKVSQGRSHFYLAEPQPFDGAMDILFDLYTKWANQNMGKSYGDTQGKSYGDTQENFGRWPISILIELQDRREVSAWSIRKEAKGTPIVVASLLAGLRPDHDCMCERSKELPWSHDLSLLAVQCTCIVPRLPTKGVQTQGWKLF